jgi:hypothetical protein
VPTKQQRSNKEKTMRHPFDGILGSFRQEEASEPEKQAGPTRREALGQMAFAAAGLLGLHSVAQAQVNATTQALGEEGGPPVATTLALGEEGGATTARNEEGMATLTTEPFGEEAGNVTSKPAPGLEDGGAGGATTERVGEEGGVITQALNEQGVTTRAVGEEGGLTRARGEEGGPVVKVQPLAKDLTDKQMEAAWADLASTESPKAVQACAVLYGAKKAVPFLKDNLKLKVPEADERQIAQLIRDLDSDEFQVREKATTDLEKLGLAAVPALQQALQDTKSAEVRMRLSRLLEKSKDAPALLQVQRGLEVLVALRTKEAREVVEGLAKGPEKEWLTQAAKKALERMPK